MKLYPKRNSAGLVYAVGVGGIYVTNMSDNPTPAVIGPGLYISAYNDNNGDVLSALAYDTSLEAFVVNTKKGSNETQVMGRGKYNQIQIFIVSV